MPTFLASPANRGSIAITANMMLDRPSRTPITRAPVALTARRTPMSRLMPRRFTSSREAAVIVWKIASQRWVIAVTWKR